MPVPLHVTVYPSNDNTVDVLGLGKEELQANGTLLKTALNAATVTATLKDASGAAVTGFNGVALNFVATSLGHYSGSVEETFNPAPGTAYTLVIDAAEAGLVLHLEIPATVEVRRK